jgi:hypothetical protein
MVMAIADMVALAFFFFLLRPGEYTGTKSDMTPFRVQDVQLCTQYRSRAAISICTVLLFHRSYSFLSVMSIVLPVTRLGTCKSILLFDIFHRLFASMIGSSTRAIVVVSSFSAAAFFFALFLVISLLLMIVVSLLAAAVAGVFFCLETSRRGSSGRGRSVGIQRVDPG